MEFVLMLVIVIGLWYWFVVGFVGYIFFLILKFFLFIGFSFGLFWGDVIIGMIVGVSIEMVYLGMVVVGGNILLDKCLVVFIVILVVF